MPAAVTSKKHDTVAVPRELQGLSGRQASRGCCLVKGWLMAQVTHIWARGLGPLYVADEEPGTIVLSLLLWHTPCPHSDCILENLRGKPAAVTAGSSDTDVASYPPAFVVNSLIPTTGILLRQLWTCSDQPEVFLWDTKVQCPWRPYSPLCLLNELSLNFSCHSLETHVLKTQHNTSLNNTIVLYNASHRATDKWL